jgi:4-carboxymuconolactone decarboxylase
MTLKLIDKVRFPALAESEMTSEQKRIADSIKVGRKSLSGPFHAMLRSPDLAGPLERIGAYLRFSAPMSQKLKELAIIVVARYWSAQFEWVVHRKLAEDAGLAASKADTVMAGRRPIDFDPDEDLVFRFVVQLLLAGFVNDATFDEAKARFGEPQVADLIGLVGYYCTVSFFLNVDRQPIPEGTTGLPALATRPFTDALSEQENAGR